MRLESAACWLASAVMVGAVAIGVWAQTTAPATGKVEVYTTWPFDAKEAAKRQQETAAALKVPKDVTLDLGKGVTMKFVLIPAGTFMMGSPVGEKERQGNETQHEVTIMKPYYMGVYKVRQTEYETIMGKNPSMKETVSKMFPVNALLANDAMEFCKKVSEVTKRKVHLPTEAQWEFACRAGSAGRFCFGDDETKLPEYAWYRDNLGGQLHPVGQKKPNGFGMYDVHGLMWEYCSDYFRGAIWRGEGGSAGAGDGRAADLSRRDVREPGVFCAMLGPHRRAGTRGRHQTDVALRFSRGDGRGVSEACSGRAIVNHLIRQQLCAKRLKYEFIKADEIALLSAM